MNVDYESLAADLESGAFREELREELTAGFRQIHASGERLPPASHYASEIAAIVNDAAPEPLSPDLAFHLYQETLAAVESAHATVLGEDLVS